MKGVDGFMRCRMMMGGEDKYVTYYANEDLDEFAFVFQAEAM